MQPTTNSADVLWELGRSNMIPRISRNHCAKLGGGDGVGLGRGTSLGINSVSRVNRRI